MTSHRFLSLVFLLGALLLGGTRAHPQACNRGFRKADCADDALLEQVRAFNQWMNTNAHVVDTLHYSKVRKLMTDAGLDGNRVHVGHIQPDTDKTTQDEYDYGWNLFAQLASDNRRLGHKLVGDAELEYYRREPPPITHALETAAR
eukprot:XP_001693059.1 predicted protein [Chlamydomonas reinhardtii]